MSFFNFLLTKKNIDLNSLRNIRELRLTDEEFNQLCASIKEKNKLFSLDPRDATLYYAFWWQKQYNGGKPSKEGIFASLEMPYSNFDCQDFYKHAKKGAVQLGVKWIKKQSTLFFRTLLIQGGLPVRHITSNYNSYYRFLSRILEMNPESIEDFIYDPDITKILPPSSRNEVIYESCLEIVKAIWNDDPSFSGIFEQEESLSQIFTNLRTKKRRIGNVARKNIIKSYWLLNTNADKYSISLSLKIPNVIDKETFLGLFPDLDQNQLSKRYSFFINENLICDFVENIGGNFNSYWHTSTILWDTSEVFPEAYLTDNTGKKFVNATIINTVPSMSYPMLWGNIAQDEWALEKSNCTKADRGLVLFNDNYSTNDFKLANINSIDFKLAFFEEEIVLKSVGEDLVFKTSQPIMDFSLFCSKPDWLMKSNISVTRGDLKVYVFDENGNSGLPDKIEFRKPGKDWSVFTNILPIGLVELKITKNNISELTHIYNIGMLDLTVLDSNYNAAELVFNNLNFNISINESSLYHCSVSQNRRISLELQNNRNYPKSIKASIKLIGDRRALLTEISSPFKGLELLDKEGAVVTDKSNLLLNNLLGLRILNNKDSKIFIRMFNKNHNEIKIIRECHAGSVPVNSFLDDFKKLFMLTDALIPDSSVQFQFCSESINSSFRTVKEFSIKRYGNAIGSTFIDEKCHISLTTPSQNSLFAIPLDCPVNKVNLIPLTQTSENEFVFDNPTSETNNYILFSSMDNENERTVPLFISTDIDNVETDDDDRLKRVEMYKNLLLTENCTGENWMKFITYFFICKTHDLPYSTFDILKTVAVSPEIAAKSFFVLRKYNQDDEFLYRTFVDFENDLGFCFYWISKITWRNALEWADFCKDLIEDLGNFLSNNEPSDNFIKLPMFHFMDLKIQSLNFAVGSQIQNLRMALGERILNEIPVECPKVNDVNKNILRVTTDNARVKILLKTPVAVAQSILHKETDIWNNTHLGDTVRRNMKYAYELNPEWFSRALLYSLNHVN